MNNNSKAQNLNEQPDNKNEPKEYVARDEDMDSESPEKRRAKTTIADKVVKPLTAAQ